MGGGEKTEAESSKTAIFILKCLSINFTAAANTSLLAGRWGGEEAEKDTKEEILTSSTINFKRTQFGDDTR